MSEPRFGFNVESKLNFRNFLIALTFVSFCQEKERSVRPEDIKPLHYSKTEKTNFVDVL